VAIRNLQYRKAEKHLRFCTAIWWSFMVASVLAQNLNYGYVPRIGTEKRAFTFAIWGDPQVAYYEPGTKFGGRENKINYEEVVPRLKKSVELTNQLAPEFVITLGDNIHNAGEWENFKVLVDCVQPLRMPLYLLMGNHDHAPPADTFATNPIKNLEFANFVWAQKQINGLDLVVYSFDAGDWHFVLFSEPGLIGYGVDAYLAKHPEYLVWLDADLQANQDRPTMFFTHHPVLPVGNAKFDLYGPGAVQRRQLVEILTRYGNVKYAFFGHVHNTVASVPLISWRYQGAAFIVMPNSAVTARRSDYLETARSSYGVAQVKLNQQNCETITFHTLAGETITINPAEFAVYDDSYYGYLKPEYDLPAESFLRNGDFETPLENGWFANHLLPYDSPPLARRYITSDGVASGARALYLYSKALPDSMNTPGYIIASLRQALTVPAAAEWPVLRLKCKILSKEYHLPEVCNAFIEITGYKRGERIREFGLGYGLGRTYAQPDVRGPYASLNISPVLDQWQELALYPRSDYEHYFTGKKWQDLGMDCLVVTLGVFNDNYSTGNASAEIGAAFDAVEWFTVPNPTPLTSGVTETRNNLPRGFVLYQNHPNPFNPSTTFTLYVPQKRTASLRIHDLAGRVVADLFSGEISPGMHRINWWADAGLASGVYWAVLRTQTSRSAIKVLLLR
jgi:hypothetical protein